MISLNNFSCANLAMELTSYLQEGPKQQLWIQLPMMAGQRDFQTFLNCECKVSTDDVKSSRPRHSDWEKERDNGRVDDDDDDDDDKPKDDGDDRSDRGDEKGSNGEVLSKENSQACRDVVDGKLSSLCASSIVEGDETDVDDDGASSFCLAPDALTGVCGKCLAEWRNMRERFGLNCGDKISSRDVKKDRPSVDGESFDEGDLVQLDSMEASPVKARERDLNNNDDNLSSCHEDDDSHEGSEEGLKQPHRQRFNSARRTNGSWIEEEENVDDDKEDDDDDDRLPLGASVVTPQNSASRLDTLKKSYSKDRHTSMKEKKKHSRRKLKLPPGDVSDQSWFVESALNAG